MESILVSHLLFVILWSKLSINISGITFSSGEVVGYIDSDLITEASGCAASRVFPDTLYTHNDHGDSARIFAVNATNASLKAVIDIGWVLCN